MNAFTVPAGADWASIAFLNEIAVGIVERNNFLYNRTGWYFYPYAGIPVHAGDDVQRFAFWAALQANVEELAATGFWLRAASGGPAGTTYTRATLRAAAGLGASWEARPGDGGATVYRRMEAGDFIGPWVFSELQACLKLMTHVVGLTSVSNGSGMYGYGTGDTRELAITACEAATAASGSSPAHAFRLCRWVGGPHEASQRHTTALYSAYSADGLTATWDLWFDVAAYGVFDAAGTGWVEGWNRVATGLGPAVSYEAGAVAFPAAFPAGWPVDIGVTGFTSTARAVMQGAFSHGLVR